MLLFIHGPDTYRARGKVAAIVNQYRTRHPGAFELHSFDFSEHSDGELPLDALRTGGLFASHKLLILKELFQAPFMTVKALWEWLKASALKTSAETTLLVWERGDLRKKDILKTDDAKKLFGYLMRNALVEEYPVLGGEAFRHWAKGEMKKRSALLPAKTLEALCRACQGDSWRLAFELEKCALGYPIMAPRAVEAGIFDLVRALWRRDQKTALSLLDALLGQGVNEFYILAMMAYATRKSLERSAAPQLLALYQRIAEADLKIKTGARDARLALELLTLRLAAPQASLSRQ